MRTDLRPADTENVRPPAVAGSFYPADPGQLADLVDALVAAADGVATPVRMMAGLLVPHAGLVYSGLVAASAWRTLSADPGPGRAPTVVLLGTNHSAPWFDQVGAWPTGAWRTPLGDVAIDEALAADVLHLGRPFVVDPSSHADEHSIEVQLPFLRRIRPDAPIVPLAVAAGTDGEAVDAGERLGRLLAARRAAGAPIVLAISSDMAHYPGAGACAEVTARLVPAILERDAEGVARIEVALRRSGIPGLVCGMCGIEPTVLGLAALREMGASVGVELAAATSADAGGPASRTVGYLAVAFPG